MNLHYLRNKTLSVSHALQVGSEGVVDEGLFRFVYVIRNKIKHSFCWAASEKVD